MLADPIHSIHVFHRDFGLHTEHVLLHWSHLCYCAADQILHLCLVTGSRVDLPL